MEERRSPARLGHASSGVADSSQRYALPDAAVPLPFKVRWDLMPKDEPLAELEDLTRTVARIVDRVNGRLTSPGHLNATAEEGA